MFSWFEYYNQIQTPCNTKQNLYNGRHGEVAEWSNARDSKSCIRATVSRVRIPSSPPEIIKKRPFGRFFIHQNYSFLQI